MTLGASALLLLSPLAVGVDAAQAATVIDCTAGPVTLQQALTVYELQGACGRVEITGTNITVSLTSAAELRISNTNETVTAAGRIDELVVTGAGVVVRASTIGTTTARGIRLRLDADEVGVIRVRGGSARMHVGSATRLTTSGIDGRFRFDRLVRVLATRDAVANDVVVRKGATRVSDAGRSNRIRVHTRRG